MQTVPIEIKDQTVIFSNKELDLSRSEFLLKLFESFHASSETRLDLEGVISKVFFNGQSTKDEPHLNGLTHAAVKLISHARKLATDTFNERGQKEKYDWFYYDPVTQSWTLCVRHLENQQGPM